jgi:dolichyl-diphosphooligosaccharide--protein glycosyltransferase
MHHVLLLLIPAGLWYIFRKNSNEGLFLAAYLLVSTYFVSVMHRLVLVQGPAVCLVAGVGASALLSRVAARAREGGSWIEVLGLAALLGFLLKGYVAYVVFYGAEYLSSPSVVLMSQGEDGRVVIDDFREAYYWLRMNSDPGAKVMSWWDYGYQITGFSNRTTIVDNNTWNTTHIATVGLGMASSEDEAAEVVDRLGADYVLVVFGGLSGYDGDDGGKFYWMVSIGSGVYPHIKIEDYYVNHLAIDGSASPAWRSSLMYKASYYRFG